MIIQLIDIINLAVLLGSGSIHKCELEGLKKRPAGVMPARSQQCLPPT
jgi:hypothetical protein